MIDQKEVTSEPTRGKGQVGKTKRMISGKVLSSHSPSSRQPYKRNDWIWISLCVALLHQRPNLRPSLLPDYIFWHQQNRLTQFPVFLKASQLQPTTKCKRSPSYSTQATCNEPPQCHLPSLPLYRIRNSVSPSPSFIFFANTSRSPCLPVAPAPRRIMPTAPLLRAGADMRAAPLQLRERRVQQAQGKGEVDGCCWMQEAWRYWAVTSRG